MGLRVEVINGNEFAVEIKAGKCKAIYVKIGDGSILMPKKEGYADVATMTKMKRRAIEHFQKQEQKRQEQTEAAAIPQETAVPA